MRRAYPDSFYTACMAEAYPLWHELERQSNSQLLHEVGLLYFGQEHSTDLMSVVAGLSGLRVDHEVLVNAHHVFPQLHLENHEIGVWTPRAGWVNADASVATALGLAKKNGAEVKDLEKVSFEQVSAQHDAVVVTPGPWIRSFVDVPVEVTIQTVAYVDAQIDGPVWIEDGAEFCYGFPSESKGCKVGVHNRRIPIDPDNPNRDPDSHTLESVRSVMKRRFGIGDAQIVETVGCLYTNTRNEDFLLGRLGDNGFFASACSGHGFKFGPWIGKLMGDFVEGRDKPEDHPRFFFTRSV